MYAVGRLSSYISRGVYTVSGPFHPFGGAVDIIVVEQQDGTFKSSPWYVRFGKFQGVLKTKEKVVDISVNGVQANFHMYLDHKGEAYFLREVDVEEGEHVHYPSSSGDETDQPSNVKRTLVKSKSCEFDTKESETLTEIDVSNGKILARKNSRKSKILGLVFGRKSMKENGFREAEDGAGVQRVNSLERAEIAADLLEVRWSTTLATRKYRKDKASRLSDYNKGVNPVENATIVSEKVTESRDGNYWEEKSCEVMSEVSRNIDELGNAQNENCKADSSYVEAKGTKEQFYNGGIVEMDADSDEVGKVGDVKHFVYCEASESTTVGLDGSTEETHETLYISRITDGQVQVVTESLRETREVLADQNSSPESSIYEEKETLNSSTISGEMDSSNLTRNHYVVESKGTLMNPVENDNVPESLAKVNNSETEPMEEVSDEQFQEAVQSESSLPDDSREMNPEKPSLVPECHDQLPSVDPTPGPAEEIRSLSTCMPEIQHAMEFDDHDDGINCGSITLNEIKLSPQGSFEGKEILLGYCSSSDYSEIQSPRSTSPDFIEKEQDTVTPSVGIEEADNVRSLVQDSSESLESLPCEFKDMDEISSSASSSSPIAIPRSSEAAPEKGQRLVKSLPTVEVHDDSNVRLPLSGSLDSNLSTFVRNDISDKDQQTAQEQPTGEESSLHKQFGPAKPAVEISLCKHLLYEGMGLDAASEAFNAEKLDIDKFASLGPDITKNDRLVVRISGHYYPWEEAQPIILGLVSFGKDHIFEPKGRIAIEQVDRTLQGNPTEVIVASGGSWRIWPFSLKKSKSKKAVQQTLDGTQNLDRSESGTGSRDENFPKTKATKKKVRVIIPTSEELASLNLKEGRNVITFTFSTAMLGKQQVDARIYLWKWNTRIVISDVDGTITKSDVLGQFMPLVGVDWSQTGVAHLFSAIKDNGYQLLFLSARAISQAYHTRQFLFSLKQDGKGLPDGPVVISPDGLFPSLYREVIRRAPHEFKIGCLEDIKALFPSDCNPFYAGFGNRDTDEISYLKVGIPIGKIFIINPKEDFNAWNFWKLPPPDIDI
ncbi:Lipin, N-terminal [Dillenia turbinata]|uniref:phosphatidate phosphatase n=1 Tax=Dillenia turbinata TaxID=194707 RepID=A0AAN8W417_9MAGN